MNPPPASIYIKNLFEMDKHVFLCETESEYESLVYDTPHVALTEDDDTVHYDKPKIIVNGYEFVDMGTSVLWATCNIGAKSPEEYGWYFKWGRTTAYNSDRTPIDGGDAVSFVWSNSPYLTSGSGSTAKWSKYTATNETSSTGIADNKFVLEPEDDAAYMHIGGECRMPTKTEFQELLNACNTIWVDDYNGTGINGQLFTLKIDPSKTLFFPASGALDSTMFQQYGTHGYYWSSSLNRSGYAWINLFDESIKLSDMGRYRGHVIRPVLPK